MIHRLLLVATLGMFVLLVACSHNPPASANTAVPFERAALGLAPDYQLSPYPVDNFGLFTAYHPPAGTEWSEKNEICATWSCLGVDTSAVPADAKLRLTLNGFADVGDGGNVSLSSDQQNSFAINLLLPGLAKLIDVKGNLDWQKNVTAKITMGNAHKRVLNRDKAVSYINSLPSTSEMKSAFDKGDLVLIVSDFVVDSLDADITVDKKWNAGASASLSDAVQKVNLPVGKDANLSGKIGSDGKGTYHLQIKNPVVLAVLPKSQPAGGVLTATPDDPWKDWVLITDNLKRNLK